MYRSTIETQLCKLPKSNKGSFTNDHYFDIGFKSTDKPYLVAILDKDGDAFPDGYAEGFTSKKAALNHAAEIVNDRTVRDYRGYYAAVFKYVGKHEWELLSKIK